MIKQLPSLHFSLSLLLAVFILSSMSCGFTQKIKDGNMAYERKQYVVATDLLASEFAKSKSRVERGQLAYLMGKSYAALGDVTNSIDWYKKAYDNAYGEEALIQYAFALKQDEQYEEAADAFKDVGLETGDPITYRKEITACTIASEWINTPIEERAFDITASAINTSSSEYAPTFFQGDKLVFTSDREDAIGEETYNWTGRGFSDLFIKENNSVSSFDGPFNSKHNDGTIAFNGDQTYAVFTRCYRTNSEDAFCQLMETNLIDGSWSIPQPMSFLESEVNYGQPSLSPDGDVLYFSSNHPDGWGGYDIYRAVRAEGEWNEPVILPLRLNTIEDDRFPFITNDTLYYSSNGFSGMGGLDIFKTYIRSNGEWAPVENLKYPINSGGDDFGFIIRSTNKTSKVSEGYFSSNRKDGLGGDDIYLFTEKVPVIPEPEVIEPEPIDSTEILATIEKNRRKYKIIGYVTADAYTNPADPNSKINGTTTPVLNASIMINFSEGEYQVQTDQKGYFEKEITTDGKYDFQVSAADYLNNTAALNTAFNKDSAPGSEQLFKVEVKLDRIFKNVEINLDNIYYDLNKAMIRADAQPTLVELATTLSQNPQIRIQLSSHTDCQGEDAYNEDLSQRRAESAVDFLIKQGISPTRMIAKGYGETRPADNCNCNDCSKDQHQANRRTTFKIID